MKTEISVIVPTLNEEKYLEKCLRSIVNQKTILNYELIVADGGSEDKTKEIAKKYADRFLVTKQKGIWIGRNTGAKSAKGSLFVFIDADTIIPPNYLDVVHAVMRDEELLGLSCAFRFGGSSRTLRALQELSNKYLLLKGSFGKGEILGFNNAVRKKVFFRAGGFPNAPLEDGAFARKLHRLGRVTYLPEPYVTTSARRLEKGRALKAIVYYANLSIATDFPNSPLKNLLKYKRYLPER